MRRYLLGLAAATAALLLVEGIASVGWQRSLVAGLRGAPERSTARPDTSGPDLAERMQTARSNPGLYRVHADPLVGYVLRADAELSLLESTVHTDHVGMRRRPGPPPTADAFRIVVLGDSVAFGVGLDDDETLAHRMETLLAAVRGPDARPVVCHTIAIPGWNHRNAVHFLLDHLDAIDPDLVLYLPIGNDLTDGDGVYETGHRRKAPDLSSPDPWAQIGTPFVAQYIRDTVLEAGADGGAIGDLSAALDRPILTSDITPESSRRFDENVASIRLLAESLERAGARLALVQYAKTGRYGWHLRRRLIESGPTLPLIPLFEDIRVEMTLGDDPHPNADTVRAAAVWIVEELFARGWLDRGADRAVPEADAAPAGRLAPLHAGPQADAAILELAARARDESRAMLRPRFDLADMTGIMQVYGTLNADGSAGARLFLALAAEGGKLEVELEAIPERPDLYPLSVLVLVDGQAVGSLQIPPGGRVRKSLVLPSRPADADVIEVRLVPERWVVRLISGRERITSFRPLSVACLR